MYKGRLVLNKLDGLGDMVCHYRQKEGICTGVCLEWLRRVMLKRKEDLLPSSGDLGYGMGLGALNKIQKKETRWAATQKGVYKSARQAFHAALIDSADSSVDAAARRELNNLVDIKDLEGANRTGMQQGLYMVSESALSYAKRKNLTAWHSKGLTGHEVKRVKELAEVEYEKKLELAYYEWRKTCPMEMGMFKECSKDVEEVTYDEQGVQLRARFSGLKVVEGANALKVNTDKAFMAVKQAMTDPQFTLNRGLMIGVLEANGGGHSHAVYYSQDHPTRYLWIDPNYGVWRMTLWNVVNAMIYLYDQTDIKGEKGVYQVNGTLIPSAFEYSIWEVKT